MKKLLSIATLIILVCCASSSCQGGGATIPDVEQAKIRAVKAVDNAFNDELSKAKAELDSCKQAALKDISAKHKVLNADLDAYTVKVDSMASDVEKRIAEIHGEVTKEIRKEVAYFEKDIDNIYLNINVNRAIAITTLVLVVVIFIVILRLRPSEKRVNGIIEDSLQQNNYGGCFNAYARVSEIVDDKLSGAGKPSQNPEQVFNSQMTAWLNNKQNHATIIRILGGSQPNVVNSAVNNTASNVANAGYVANNTPAYQASNTVYAQSQPVTEYALYARERLANASKTYVAGKSIYKLILESENSTTASIVLCAEESERIIAISDYLEEDCCVFEKLNSSPSTITVVNPGRAELRNGQWTLIDKVKVELR